MAVLPKVKQNAPSTGRLHPSQPGTPGRGPEISVSGASGPWSVLLGPLTPTGTEAGGAGPNVTAALSPCSWASPVDPPATLSYSDTPGFLSLMWGLGHCWGNLEEFSVVSSGSEFFAQVVGCFFLGRCSHFISQDPWPLPTPSCTTPLCVLGLWV